jgi:hypothetical protein
MDIKAFIPTRGYTPRMTTHCLLVKENIPFTFVTYDEQLIPELERRGGEVVICDVGNRKFGNGERLGYKRKWIEDNLVKDGERYAMLDDDIEQLSQLKPSQWSKGIDQHNPKFRELFSAKCTVARALNKLNNHMDVTGLPYAGLMFKTSLLFRLRQWCYGSVVGSAFCISEKTKGMSWSKLGLEDFHRTAHCIYNYGGAARLNWICHHTKAWQPGGIGTKAEREKVLPKILSAMQEEFPGLINIKPDGWPIFNRKGVNQCRKQHQPNL